MPKRCAMLWEVEISRHAADGDLELDRVRAEFPLLAHRDAPKGLIGTARGYLLEGDLDRDQVLRFIGGVLVDPLVETWVCNEIPLAAESCPGTWRWTVLLKPGVMDPVAQTVLETAAN